AIETREALETEAARMPGRDRERRHGGFDGDRAAAAHGIEERLAGLPSGELHDPGCEVFLQRRLARILAVAAPVERLARRIDVERDCVLVEERLDAHPGRAGIDVRPAPAVGPEPVAHRVLDRQSRELETLERRADRLDVDPYGELLAEPFGPSHCERGLVDVSLGA